MNKEKAIITYVSAWNADDSKERRRLLQSSFTEEGKYVDPHVPGPAENIQQMEAVIQTFRSRLPHRLSIIGQPELHHQVFRLKWKMDDQGSVLSKGIFVGEFNPDNKIKTVIGFIDA